jgi:hypothetical protein
MADDERSTARHMLACDLAHELFLPSHALTLEDAAPERLYAALAEKGYVWTGNAWKPASEAAQDQSSSS